MHKGNIDKTTFMMYQRMMIKIFEEEIREMLEVYADDMIEKSSRE